MAKNVSLIYIKTYFNLTDIPVYNHSFFKVSVSFGRKGIIFALFVWIAPD